MDYVMYFLFGFMGLIGLMTTYIYIHEKKYLYVPYGIMLIAISGALFWDRGHDTSYTRYVFIVAFILYLIESIVTLCYLLKQKGKEVDEEAGENKEELPVFINPNVKPGWVVVWIVIKILIIYFLVQGI
ncbi:hypothetical protein [Rossellomorea marisflavi]|uniref:hypothetical protein n=1 Tax=Rossellomorea marisflavi TaxID=189381 RepID=UPI003F9ED7E1